jgi:hypothetical protein
MEKEMHFSIMSTRSKYADKCKKDFISEIVDERRAKNKQIQSSTKQSPLEALIDRLV